MLTLWQVEAALAELAEDHRKSWSRSTGGAGPTQTSPNSWGCPEGTVKSRVYYGLRAMRGALEAQGWRDGLTTLEPARVAGRLAWAGPPVDLDQDLAVVLGQLGQRGLDLPEREHPVDPILGQVRPPSRPSDPEWTPSSGARAGRLRRARTRSITTLRRMAKSHVRCVARAGS